MSDSVERLNSIFGNGSNITMSANKTPYNLQYLTTKKQRNSPTPSILKTPTPIFVTSRRSSVRTKKLTFANGPAISDNEINERREGSHDSASTTSTIDLTDSRKLSYDHRAPEGKLIEVALSPVKKMKVSPDSWNAFLEYQKYKDYSSETEKTDYTYSRLSKFRDKEIIPGFRARPNLSRNPIYFNSSHQSFSSWSPETSYSVKRVIYENSSSSSSRRKFEPDTTTYDRSNLYQNEISEYSKHDGYYSDDALRSNEKYQSYARFSDDGNLFRNRKGFAHSSLRHDRQSHLGTGWGIDETDDNFISSTHREVAPSYSSASRAIVFLSAIYTTLFHGIASTTSAFKDLFSRYILRRKTYPYNNYSSVAYRPWSQSGTYSYGKYQYYNQGRLSRWWYQSFLYTLYSKMMSTITGSSQYVRSKYYQSSRRGRLLWILIPLLLLLALWLSRAEVEDAYVSNQITAFKCKANQYLSPARSHVNGIWRKVSGYGEQIFGRSLQPILYLFRFAGWLIGSCLDWTLSLIGGVLAGVFSLFDMIADVLSRFWILFTNVVSDAVEKKDNISSAVYNFFSGIIFTVLSGLSFVLGSLGSVVVNAFELFKSLLLVRPFSQSGGDVAFETAEMEFAKYDVKDQSAYWEGLRKRIEDLELELEKVKEEKKAGSLIYQKQLENNYKALQRYQAIVNEALRRQSSKPPQLSKSSIQYYLDNMTDELKKWILAHFILKSESKDMDENKFASLMAKYSNRSGEELKMLQNEFSRFVRQYSAELSSLKMDLNVAHYNDYNGNDLPLTLIKRIVADEIKLHDADKTGKVDFALQSAGGHVLGVKCTKSFNHCFRYNNIFGLHVCSQLRRNAPEEAISPGMAPGQCWAFAGSQGFLILELSHSIIVTGFTMEHISRLVSPNGRIESAPRKFSMWGLKTELDMDPYLFGEYEYKDNNETYQYFPVINYSAHPYKIVELSIASNHGNPNYTCLYRIRVHGDIYPSHL